MGAHAERLALQEKGYRGQRHYYVQDEIRAFERGWAEKMVDIWQEQIEKLGVVDTGALWNSAQELIHTGQITTIEHQFLLYGIYMALGVGKGYLRGNPGDLEFLGASYRKKMGTEDGQRYGRRAVGLGLSRRAMKRFPHNERGAAIAGGHPREVRDWFFKKYWYSRLRLNEREAAAYGHAYKGMLVVAFEALFKSTRFL